MKELYTKKEAMGILGVGREKLAGLVKSGALQPAGRSITRASIEAILGHPIDQEVPATVASSEPEGPRVPTPLEEMRERKRVAVETEELLRLENEIEGYKKQQQVLIDLVLEERDMVDRAVVIGEKLSRQHTRVRSLLVAAKSVLPATRAEALAIIEEAHRVEKRCLAEADAEAAEILTTAKDEAESLTAKANDANEVAIRALAAAGVQVKEVDQRDFDTDQYRIIKARIAALPDKVRAKHFPKVDRAFLPLPGDKGMPVSDPDKRVEVVVDRGFAISEESKWTAMTWAFWVVIVAIFGWALWQWLKLIG